MDSWLQSTPSLRVVGHGICVACKASRMLCGKPRCPLLLRYSTLFRNMPAVGIHMHGSSPPGVFVGRFGYPKVNVGPLVPPFHGDTSLLDLPERWLDCAIEDIVSFRSHLVRGLMKVDVAEARIAGGDVDLIQELAVADNPTDLEVEFRRRPTGSVVLRDDVQPYGPVAPIERLRGGSSRAHPSLEKAWMDSDLRAAEAIVWLYREGVEVSRISRALSAGVLGLAGGRRFVPTRWSITAVDDTIGKHLVQEVKANPSIDGYRVYESWRLDNRFVILLFSGSWCYELLEAWYPGSTWNPHGGTIVMFGDWEGYNGRSTYASVGGCYYAARLAIVEALRREGRQAGALVLREAHPGYIMPVGVWNVRENVRRAMGRPYMEFPDLRSALLHISHRLEIPISEWVSRSHLLRDLLHQRKLEDFQEVYA